ncbi:MAG: multicopper oxidase domain-containing protein [Anaerolineales bacterium]|nr:multicopper oxidase domain-containing protein [Anaerolineales bacterium]
MSAQNVSRRKFLTLAGLGLTTGLGVAACAQAPSVTPMTLPTITPGAGDGMDMPTATPGDAAADMDDLHKQGVETFVAGIGADPNFWRPPMDYTLDGAVKVFTLTCTEGPWEVTPGQSVPAMLYNGLVPGPEIRVTEGDQVRIVCVNQMTQSTSIHFHGVRAANSQDGVPYLTQDPIRPGETFTYEFTARNAGSHMYHSHHNAAEQVTKGLMGGFIIEPKDKTTDPAYDAEYTMVLNDSGIGLTINGKGFPYTQPIVAKLGQTIRVRYMNEGLLIHPMHLHGMPQTVFAKDGYNLSVPFLADTLIVGPGERWDVTVLCDEPGVWAFHCHILTHAESSHGMFGMVTALIVQE